jgi:tetratricopeptide (TPR) repeat protein
MKWLHLLAALSIVANLAGGLPSTAKPEKAKEGFSGVGSFDAWKQSVPEFQAGLRCMKNKRWDDATGHFKASLALYEFQPKAWIEIGRANEERGGDIADSEHAYREALKLDSANWHAWKRLANVLLIQKKYRAARESAASAIGLNPPQAARAELDRMVQAIEAGEKSQDKY